MWVNEEHMAPLNHRNVSHWNSGKYGRIQKSGSDLETSVVDLVVSRPCGRLTCHGRSVSYESVNIGP